MFGNSKNKDGLELGQVVFSDSDSGLSSLNDNTDVYTSSNHMIDDDITKVKTKRVKPIKEHTETSSTGGSPTIETVLAITLFIVFGITTFGMLSGSVQNKANQVANCLSNSSQCEDGNAPSVSNKVNANIKNNNANSNVNYENDKSY